MDCMSQWAEALAPALVSPLSSVLPFPRAPQQVCCTYAQVLTPGSYWSLTEARIQETGAAHTVTGLASALATAISLSLTGLLPIFFA